MLFERQREPHCIDWHSPHCGSLLETLSKCIPIALRRVGVTESASTHTHVSIHADRPAGRLTKPKLDFDLLRICEFQRRHPAANLAGA